MQVENQRERGEARDKAERVSHARSLRGALLKSNHVTRYDVYLSSLRGEIVESLNHGARNGGRCLVSCAIGESQKSAIKIRDRPAPPIEKRSRGRRFERSPEIFDRSLPGVGADLFFPLDLAPSIFLRSSTNHPIDSPANLILNHAVRTHTCCFIKNIYIIAFTLYTVLT